jgi:CubicO group peptidase (beta-lactamase class C family)
MISLPVGTREEMIGDLRSIGHRLCSSSAADTVACAYGVGDNVVAWYDDSEGRYFDLASLTKALFTAPSVLVECADRSLLDEPVSTFLNWMPAGPGTPNVRQLLTHSGGLPSELPAVGHVSEVQTWLTDYVRRLPAPADLVVYSDPSYWLLGNLVSTLSDETLSTVFERSPSMCADGFRFGEVPAAMAVPAGPVQGDVQLVHDPAARRLGVSGHAGAFGTLPAVVTAVMSWLDHTWVPPSIAAEVFTCHTHRTPGGHRNLAWTLAGDPFHVVAHDWPTTTVSHTGFTGVCVALDPVSRWWGVYLSNAVPIDRDATPVLVARRHFHAVVAAHLRTIDQSTGS